nr:carboxypeptidase regulatory-like domain-containing protein [Bacteroidota bacterium]
MKNFTKRLLLVCLMVIPVFLTFGQTVVFEEDFTDGACPPANWEVTPAGTANWVISESTYAGGTSPEGKYYYFPTFTGTTRLITPVINTSAYETLDLEFIHNLTTGAANTDYSFKVETTSDGGTTWTEVWSVTPGGSIPAGTVEISIENSDVGSENFQFCHTYESTTGSGAYHYYFDDIVLTGTPLPEEYSVTFNIEDEAANPIEGAEIAMADNGTMTTDALGQAVFVDVAPGTYTYDITASGFAAESGSVTVADADVIVDVVMATASGPTVVFSEDFTDGACPP